MGVEDRDWFWEDRDKREKEYGGDFSLHSRKVNIALSPNGKNIPSQPGKVQVRNRLFDLITIASGFLVYCVIKKYSVIPGLWDVNVPNNLWRIMILFASFVFGIFLFICAVKRRNDTIILKIRKGIKTRKENVFPSKLIKNIFLPKKERKKVKQI